MLLYFELHFKFFKPTFVFAEQSSAIYSLQAIPIKKRTIKLSWNDPTYHMDIGYHVKFEKDNKWIDFNVTGRTSFVVKNLRAGMFYTFSVKRNDEFEYTIVSNTTREEGKVLSHLLGLVAIIITARNNGRTDDCHVVRSNMFLHEHNPCLAGQCILFQSLLTFR